MLHHLIVQINSRCRRRTSPLLLGSMTLEDSEVVKFRNSKLGVDVYYYYYSIGWWSVSFDFPPALNLNANNYRTRSSRRRVKLAAHFKDTSRQSSRDATKMKRKLFSILTSMMFTRKIRSKGTMIAWMHLPISMQPRGYLKQKHTLQ